jgi:plexin A
MTIEGSDLGLKEEDVRGKIHIGHVPCELVDYQVCHFISTLFHTG